MTTRLVLLTGGRSTEHDASLHGYPEVLAAVQKHPERYQLTAVVHVDRAGAARVFQDPPWPVSEPELTAGPPVGLETVLPRLRDDGVFTFSLLHGNEGEDGAWQGIAEVFDLAGNFGPVRASAVGMDKYLQGLLAADTVDGLRLPDTRLVRGRDDGDAAPARFTDIAAHFAGQPVVVKPNRMGASLLAVRLPTADPDALAAAAAAIFRYDPEVLVQEYVSGREYTCGVLATPSGPLALPVIEAVTAGRFLGHREKHHPGHVSALVHDTDDEHVTRLKAASCRLFDRLEVLGFARFDFLVRAGELYFLEVNTLPGLMPGSAYPRMLDAAGRTLLDVLDACVAGYAARSRRQTLLPYEIGH